MKFPISDLTLGARIVVNGDIVTLTEYEDRGQYQVFYYVDENGKHPVNSIFSKHVRTPDLDIKFQDDIHYPIYYDGEFVAVTSPAQGDVPALNGVRGTIYHMYWAETDEYLVYVADISDAVVIEARYLAPYIPVWSDAMVQYEIDCLFPYTMSIAYADVGYDHDEELRFLARMILDENQR